MAQAAVMIPEKIYFKIGEVCDIVGVQAHVLRYWETDFPMLSPQKNRSGQRSYRRKDVETALRIKELLYDEMFTIAGARKKLQTEQRGEAPKLKIVHSEPAREVQMDGSANPLLFEDNSFEDVELDLGNVEPKVSALITEQREAIKRLGAQLLELREMLKNRQD
jgi:DNA-binding transcriptional MerR regulator